jgi:hypothetical protein
MCRIFLETENCLLNACETDSCHIKVFSILKKQSLNILKTLNNYGVLVSATHLHSSDFVNIM